MGNGVLIKLAQGEEKKDTKLFFLVLARGKARSNAYYTPRCGLLVFLLIGNYLLVVVAEMINLLVGMRL